MTSYSNQSHYPDTEQTCSILIIPSTWLGSDKCQFDKALVWLDHGFEPTISRTRDRTLPTRPPRPVHVIRSWGWNWNGSITPSCLTGEEISPKCDIMPVYYTNSDHTEAYIIGCSYIGHIFVKHSAILAGELKNNLNLWKRTHRSTYARQSITVSIIYMSWKTHICMYHLVLFAFYPAGWGF